MSAEKGSAVDFWHGSEKNVLRITTFARKVVITQKNGKKKKSATHKIHPICMFESSFPAAVCVRSIFKPNAECTAMHV